MEDEDGLEMMAGMLAQQFECTYCYTTVHFKAVNVASFCYIYFTAIKMKKKPGTNSTHYRAQFMENSRTDLLNPS